MAPDPADEIALIEVFADTKVIGVTNNHEGMTDAEATASILDHSDRLGLPVTDALLSRVKMEMGTGMGMADP